MSDTPQGPGWRQAGDGSWHPPETGPTMVTAPATEGAPTFGGLSAGEAVPSLDVSLPKVAPIPVPELPVRPTLTAEADRRPEAGPMYPDLFSQALAGSSLANVVTVNYADGEARPGLDVPMSVGFASDQFADDPELVSASARMPAEVGAFTGASAKKRWRILR